MSRTTPGPTALPAMEVPAPRAVSGTPSVAADRQRRGDLVGVPRPHDRPRQHPVQRGVGGVQRPGQPGAVDVGDAGAAQGGDQVAGRVAAHHRRSATG